MHILVEKDKGNSPLRFNFESAYIFLHTLFRHNSSFTTTIKLLIYLTSLWYTCDKYMLFMIIYIQVNYNHLYLNLCQFNGSEWHWDLDVPPQLHAPSYPSL